jgi:hypothetical protein
MKYPKAMTVSMFFALFAAGAVFVFGFLRVPSAHAADCGITTSDIDQIAAIQNDPTLSYSDEIKQELAVRKQLVGEAISCAQQEVATFRTNLASTSVESDAQPLQAQLLGRLDEASGFYGLELTKLNSVGIAGSEAIAQEVLAWRAGTFLPLSENVNNFILWAQNQNLFDTAQARMTQTQRAVSFLEGASPNAALQAAFDGAQSSFNDAKSQNAAAKAALAQGLSPDQSLALIKQSLDSLSGAYQGFFNVSTIISGILPQ